MASGGGQLRPLPNPASLMRVPLGASRGGGDGGVRSGGGGGGGTRASHRNLLASLPEESRVQILRFTKFFSAKRENLLQVLDGDWSDAVDMLHEDEYSRDDVVSELRQLKTVVKGAVRTEHQTVVNMMVLLLKQLFEDAATQGLTSLEMDMHAVEDVTLLKEVEDLRLERQLEAPRHAEMKDTPSGRANKLLSIKDEHAELVREKGRLEGENEASLARGQALEEQAREATSERDLLQAEVASLRRQLQDRDRRIDEAAQEKDSETRIAAANLDEAKSAYESRSDEQAVLVHENERLKDRIRRLEEDSATRLNQSKAVVQMRRMLQEKNSMVADLRQRLSKYEPDSLQADDD